MTEPIMEVFKVFRSLNVPDLKFGVPVWVATAIWSTGFIMIIVLSALYFVLICSALHFFAAMLVKYVDVNFLDVLVSYFREPHGDLE